jgi:hypothetical protein
VPADIATSVDPSGLKASWVSERREYSWKHD